ncbi:MAG: peptidoglycan DD-metalloendopeptidase family protein [Selenomonadaceae bacterium]|nr:peptidoglycan DD-metalloendopeptidase family protein [Selenomonadaceae bacterium]
MADKEKALEESEAPVKETKKYQFKMTSSDGETERHWTISSGLLKFGVFSMVFGALLLIGTLGFTVWAALNFRLNQAAVTDMEQSTELQQEQLLSLSKKANKLSEQLQNLTQMESELRIQAGVAPLEKKPEEVAPTDQPIDQPTEQSSEQPSDQPTDQPIEEPPVEEISDEYDGQGGPIDDLDVDSVEEALKMLESGIVERRGSLVQLQDELKKQREQIAQIVQQRSTMAATPMTTITMPGSSVPYTNAPVMNNSFALGITDAASNVPAIWPTTGVVTSPYGLRWGGTDFHPGMDIANDMGTPIVATADGIVVVAGWNSGGYGNMVDIDHGNGIMTRYGHASQVLVSAGQYVKRGQIIALMGSTGFSTGPHVHYEVHVNGQRVNPISYL